MKEPPETRARPRRSNQRNSLPMRCSPHAYGETTRFTYRPNHEWYWFPRQKPTEVSMLKCYDSVTDGSVSRWSFHTACVDPTAPADARCRKNVVVRSFVFF